MNLQGTSSTGTTMPTFDEFYRAINQREPFPWQSRLANQVASTGKWCSEIGIPTGLGKTVCLDIAVWWLATQSDCTQTQRIAPTRIWWVVNRRLLVDSTFKHACKISKTLSDPDSEKLPVQDKEIIKIVAERLKSIAGGSQAKPLEVIRLRGGIASRRPRCPSQPAILLTTLPMYGSRLLFRGYGSSRNMRSVDAAMAGTDSLVLLDEAHLTPHLITLCSAISECTSTTDPILNESRSRPTLVQLTATGDQAGQDRFTLDDDDDKNSIVRERLDAVKLLELREKKKNDIKAKALAQAAYDLLQNASTPTTCIIFVNTPKIARETFLYVRDKKLMKNAKVLLLTGRMREFEAEQTRQDILEGMSASHDERGKREYHLIVVATQTLEVGADIDAEYLVTEQCGVRSLTQRLGRLNRCGRFKDARAVYVHMPAADRKNGWPVYGHEPNHLLEILQNRLENSSEKVNLSTRCVAKILGAPSDDHGRAPELLPGILWEWIKTSSPHKDEAPVEPYFSGISGIQMFVTVIWRAHIPENRDRLWPHAAEHEAIDVPISEFRKAWKEARDQKEIFRLGSDGITVEKTSVDSVRPGDQVVLHSDYGLMDKFGWNPDARDPVRDMSLKGHGLPLDVEAIKRICGISVSKEYLNTALGKSDDHVDIEPQEQAQAVEKILDAISQGAPHGCWGPEEWDEFVSSLRGQKAIISYKGVPRLCVKKAKKKPESEILSDDLDERSLADLAVRLEQHCEAVALFARSVCDQIGLPTDLSDIVERAGRLHDIGKADQRFQRWLDPDWNHGCVLLAKSNTPRHQWGVRRISAGWPQGGRHEALSARLVHAWLDKNPNWCDSIKRDLLMHLVISHHGKGRPLLEPITDDTSPLPVEGLISDERVSAPADLRNVDWEQPTRFRNLNDYFGPWGLALLEAILRLSDHAVSQVENIPPNENL